MITAHHLDAVVRIFASSDETGSVWESGTVERSSPTLEPSDGWELGKGCLTRIQRILGVCCSQEAG
jgi:hypothetical protein